MPPSAYNQTAMVEVDPGGKEDLGDLELGFETTRASPPVEATCEIRQCVRFTPVSFYDSTAMHRLSEFSEVKYKNSYAWVLTDVKRLGPPLVSKHKIDWGWSWW